MKTEKIESSDPHQSLDECEVPEGWLLSSVGELFQIVGGGTPSTKNPEYWEGDIPWISSADIYGLKKIVPRRNINQTAIKNSAAHLVPKGSIIVVTRVSLGRIAISDTPISYSQDCHALIPKTDSVYPLFALYYLSQAVQTFQSQSRGTTISGVTVKVVSSLPFPLPPLAEQQRIVARVEAILTHVNSARDRLSRVPVMMKKFRQAVLAAACSGRLTEGWRKNCLEVESAEKTLNRLRKEQKIKKFQKNYDLDVDSEFNLPTNWCYVNLDRLIEFNRAIRYGVLKPGDYDPSGIRLIKSGQVRDGFMDLSDIYRITPELDRQFLRTRLQGGEILLNLVGASIGRSAIAPSELSGSNVSRAIAVIPVDKSCAEYVQLNLQGPLGQKLIQSKTGGTAQPVLNLEEVRSLLIPLPPLAEQHEIVRRVGSLFERADAIEQEVVAASQRCERLTQAVLGKAFSGRL